MERSRTLTITAEKQVMKLAAEVIHPAGTHALTSFTRREDDLDTEENEKKGAVRISFFLFPYWV